MALHMQIIVVGDEESFDFSSDNTKDDATGDHDKDVVWHVVTDDTKPQAGEPGLGGVVIYSDLNDNFDTATATFDADFII